jgi:hypothetical protein
MLANLPGDVKIEVEKAIIGSESARIMDDSAQIVEFMGALSSMTTESWTIAGRQVTVTPQTEIKGTFSVGDTVKVHARVNADGSLTAIEIEGSAAAGNGNDNLNGNQNDNANENANINSNENENANENSNENDNANENSNDNLNENTNANSNGFDDDDKFEFKGTVQTILPDMWVIGGIKVAVSSETRIQNAISVGDYVEVYAITQPDGTLLAFMIELEDDGNSSNDNDNGDDGSRDDDSNSNDNDSDDHDDDSDDSNGNSDDRDDDDDSNDDDD